MHRGYFKEHVENDRGYIQKWSGFSMDRCDEHGNTLEAYCDDHTQFCCSVCVARKHRLCSSISHLPDLARGFLRTDGFKDLPAEVDKMGSRLDELKDARMKDQASLIASYNNIIDDIKAVRKNINNILDELEKKTVEQLDSMKKDLEKSIKDDLKTCAQMHDQLKTMIEQLHQITGKNKETSSYIVFRKCWSKLSEARFFVEDEKQNKGMKFKSEKSVVPFLTNLNSLGNVESVHSLPKSTCTLYLYQTQGSAQYDVKIYMDYYNCNIVGICELPKGEVVIADRDNKRVKLLDKKYHVIDYCDLSGNPQHLCHTTGNDVAVAVCDITLTSKCHEVHFLTLTGGKLQTLRKFTADHVFYTISHHQGQLFVGSSNAIYQYTVEGKFVKQIYANKGPDWQECKCAVSIDGKRIFVTNKASKLITLDRTGKVISIIEYRKLEGPKGLCVIPDGNVFVFVCCEVSNTVLQVDDKGTLVVNLAGQADGWCHPQSVCFSEQTSTLLVGNSLGGTITVFMMR